MFINTYACPRIEDEIFFNIVKYLKDNNIIIHKETYSNNRDMYIIVYKGLLRIKELDTDIYLSSMDHFLKAVDECILEKRDLTIM